MKRRAQKLTAILLSLLFLCSCVPAEPVPLPTPDTPTATPAATPSPTPAATPEPTPELFAGGCTREEIKYASEHIQDYFELYTLLNPGADVHLSGYSTNPNTNGYLEISCYGADLPAFEASGILPACVKLMYSDLSAEIAASHPVPYIPEAATHFDGGLTITLDRVVYPLYPEYLSYTWHCTQELMYGYAYSLEKYIDGEWTYVPGNYSFVALGLILPADKTERQYHSHSGNSRLGEGLYRMAISGDYPIEFVVSADAEPLEPLADVLDADPNFADQAAYSARGKLCQSNVFYKTQLPENISNELDGNLYWPKEAPTYSTEFGFGMTNDRIAAQLLADEHSYNAANDSYVSECQQLTFENNGLTLVNTTPTARAMKLAFPFSPTELTPIEFQARRINKGGNAHTGSCSFELSPPEMWYIKDGGGDFYGWSNTEELVSFSSLNWQLDQRLNELQSSMSDEDFLAQYGELSEFSFKNIGGFSTRAYIYGRVNFMVNDTARSIITDKSSTVFSGSEIYYTLSGGNLLDLVIKNAPTAIHDNGDTAPIIAPYDAAAALLPALAEIPEDVSIISAEFAYAYHYGDLSALRPTWIFTLTHRTPSPTNEKIMLDNYSFLAVDAHSGRLLK